VVQSFFFAFFFPVFRLQFNLEMVSVSPNFFYHFFYFPYQIPRIFSPLFNDNCSGSFKPDLQSLKSRPTPFNPHFDLILTGYRDTHF